jgi:hypothetical protein
LPQKTQITLHTDLPISDCLNRIRASIDEERRTLLSWSGYAGSRKVLGKIDGYEIRLQKRRYYHNDFAPYFYARLLPQTHGTRIEGRFDCSPFVKTFMRIWLILVIAGGTPIFILCLKDILTGSASVSGDRYVGVVVPPGMVLFGLLLPRIGRWLAKNEESYILEFLQSTLPARIEVQP